MRLRQKRNSIRRLSSKDTHTQIHIRHKYTLIFVLEDIDFQEKTLLHNVYYCLSTLKNVRMGLRLRANFYPSLMLISMNLENNLQLQKNLKQ